MVFKRFLAVMTGSFLVGAGINGFLVPHHLIDGGMIGIGLIVKYMWGYKPGLTIILLSVPLYIYAFIYFRTYFYNSLHGLLLSSLFIDILTPLRGIFTTSILLSALIGGILVGTGIGIMLRHKTSTGGTDLLAQFIASFTSMNVGIIIFLIDGFVILAGAPTIGLDSSLYSALTISAVGFATSVLTVRKKEEWVK
ncbi:YitT family protein [Pseudalkalibacillus caeni]|uniref:YitT family protein n=1 Tax=Exobacillus caeni TaxID=2574798 RepID=A0A5R9F6W9_9BACL|nr:YitT family protein [Pseudalkalibacillus caeni]TLS38259.1 YitT family protein [Pseudalkalibacillus caeni]